MPRWATDIVQRHNPGLADPGQPFVLYERDKSALRLAALNGQAESLGLREGQPLSDARAMVPTLKSQEIDRAGTETLFNDFSDWHSYASPLVAVLRDRAPYGDLVLDITGVSHLFGGEANMLALLVNKLRGLGFSAQGAIAGTIGAAHGLAHYRPNSVVGEDLADALAGLPIRALRLNDAQIGGLVSLGLKSVGQLYRNERRALQARFGASLLLRLDQALGFVEERFAARLPPVEHFAEQRFAEPVGLIDQVLMSVEDLSVRLAIQLAEKGLGAQTFHLLIYRVDHRVMRFSVNAFRATRDPAHITRLFANRAERLNGEFDAGFGIDIIRLAADTVSRLDTGQSGMFEAPNGVEDLERLHDRIISRLGTQAVRQTLTQDSHVPEKSAVLVGFLDGKNGTNPAEPASRPRPLRLLPRPEPVTVFAQVPYHPPSSMVWRTVSYRFVRASGPERITAEWWRGRRPVEPLRVDPAKPRPEPPPGEDFYQEGEYTRDYYIAEDETGRRFWLFRVGTYHPERVLEWFVHGFFP